MLVTLALVAQAHAVPAPDCSGNFAVADAVPGPGAPEVPFDARPAITFDGDECRGGLSWTPTLRRTDDETEVPLEATTDLAGTHLLELFPVGALDPDTAYTVSLTPIDSGEVVEFGFTTGLGEVAGLAGEPQLTVDSVSFAKRTGITLTWTAKGATDPDGLSILQIQDASAERPIHSFVVPGTGSMEQTVVWTYTDRPAEVCPQVRQLDGTGLATEWTEPTCAKVGGCSTTGESRAGVGIVAMAMLLARRRSPR
ncbi:MAG: hypothetical protein Q8P41_13325 [Pseudomonadota bacterium]|nr:hypothetical protein [Pseudomonadota bacterium]